MSPIPQPTKVGFVSTDPGFNPGASNPGAANPGAAALDPHRLLAALLAGCAPAQHITGQAEWTELVDLARSEGVGALLRHVLLDQLAPELLAAAGEALESDYHDSFYGSMLRQSLLSRLCGRLGRHGIPVLLLKGAALAHVYYEDPATRPMADLDLLVPRPRLEEAARCLEEAGFRPPSGSLAMALRSPWGHLGYLHQTNGAAVELHWNLSEMRRVSSAALAEVWAGARPAGTAGAALVMRPGHEIPLLSAHMVLRRQYATLRSLFDLHRVLLATDAQEAAVARDAATRWRLGPCTAHTLLRARELFGTPIPDELYQWAREETARDSLQGRVARQALTPGAADRPAGDLVDLVVNRNWSKLWICFPSPEAMRERYGLTDQQSLIPAYVAHVSRYLRKSPAELGRLWRAWRRSGTRENRCHKTL